MTMTMKKRTHLQMPIHHSTPGEIILGEVHDHQLDLGREIHEGFLLLDLAVAAEADAFLGFGARELGVQLLEALFAEGVDGGGVFEGGDEGVFVFRVVVGVGVPVEHFGYVCV